MTDSGLDDYFTFTSEKTEIRDEQRRYARKLADHVAGRLSEEILLCRLATSVGKTVTTLTLLDNLDVHMGLFFPEYWVARDKINGLGLNEIELIRGYSHYQPERQFYYPCYNSIARKLSKLGWNARAVCETCEYNGNCELHRTHHRIRAQKIRKFASSHAMAPGLMGYLTKIGGNHRRVAVFDESPLRSYEQDFVTDGDDLRIARDQLRSIPAPLQSTDTWECIESFVDEMTRLHNYGKYSMDYDALASSLGEYDIKTAKQINENATSAGTETARTLVSGPMQAYYPRNILTSFIDWMSFIKEKRVGAEGISVLVKRMERSGEQPRLSFGTTKMRIIKELADKGVKIVILDATGSAPIYAAATGCEVNDVRPILTRNIGEHHRLKAGYPKATFEHVMYYTPDGMNPKRYAVGANNTIAVIFDTCGEIINAYPGKKSFLVVYKTLMGIDMVDFFVKGLRMRGFEVHKDFDIHYYGSGRGTDVFGDASVVILIGKHYIPLDVAKRKAILWEVVDDDVLDLCVIEEYHQQMGRAGRKNGEPIVVVNISNVDVDLGVECLVHPTLKRMRSFMRNKWSRQVPDPVKKPKVPVKMKLRPLVLRTVPEDYLCVAGDLFDHVI